MATAQQWREAARPRTLPAAVAPVLLGGSVAIHHLHAVTGRTLAGIGLALVVALALQVGVNLANDYSDGVRGTDATRVGPQRLVGSGAASPQQVKTAALVSFAVAALAGLVLVALTGTYELLLVGATCLPAAWYYTGGRRPYGYAGLGELMVFLYFGLFATAGTSYALTGTLRSEAVWCGVASGSFACALLLVNNLRDLPGDAAVGKRTLAVRLGDARTRWLYVVLLVVPFVVLAGLSVTQPWLLLGAVAAPLAWRTAREIRSGLAGRALIPPLGATGRTQLVFALAVSVGWLISAWA